MEIQKKITVLSENLNNLRSALEDFRDHHISKKEKIKNLEKSQNQIKLLIIIHQLLFNQVSILVICMQLMAY